MSSTVCINIDDIRLPLYTGKSPIVSGNCYNSDKTFMSLCDDTARNAKMIIVSNTDEHEFINYIECLQNNGYGLISTEKIENNEYATFTCGNGLLYAYYTAPKGTVNIIYDPVSALANDISHVDSGENSAIEFYMYGLDMKCGVLPECGDADAPHIGLLLIAKCSDNSLILVDGGAPYHVKEERGERLNEFLHIITNTPAEEKVRISCWYLTHTDGDHLWGFEEFIQRYQDKYDLKSICANVPFEWLKISYPKEYDMAKAFSSWLCENYPNCKEIKIHTGQHIKFAGITMRAIYTHEDRVDPISGKNDLIGRSLNHASTVIKIETDDMSMMVLGDALESCETCILTSFSMKTLKSDIVQVSHHTFNGVSKNLYDQIAAPIHLAPVSYGWYCLRHYSSKLRALYPDFEEIFKEKTVYFCGKPEYTVGFSSIYGKICVIRKPETFPDFDINDKETEKLAMRLLDTIGNGKYKDIPTS